LSRKLFRKLLVYTENCIFNFEYTRSIGSGIYLLFGFLIQTFNGTLSASFRLCQTSMPLPEKCVTIGKITVDYGVITAFME
jgi:hypothetical protein